MKDENWEECLINNSARQISPDIERAKALKETAKERTNLITEINKKNCNFVFEDYYTSLIEIIQSLTFEKGYNVLNHVCIGFYIRDVLKKEKLYITFDDLRYKRNSLTYYGHRMEYEIAKKAINDCKKILNELSKK